MYHQRSEPAAIKVVTQAEIKLHPEKPSTIYNTFTIIGMIFIRNAPVECTAWQFLSILSVGQQQGETQHLRPLPQHAVALQHHH